VVDKAGKNLRSAALTVAWRLLGCNGRGLVGQLKDVVRKFHPRPIVLQKSKVAPVQIFGENQKRKEVDIRIVSVALSKSPTNLAPGDEVPQILTRITRQLDLRNLTTSAKRLCNAICQKRK
jgi:hypothetical protein